MFQTEAAEAQVSRHVVPDTGPPHRIWGGASFDHHCIPACSFLNSTLHVCNVAFQRNIFKLRLTEPRWHPRDDITRVKLQHLSYESRMKTNVNQANFVVVSIISSWWLPSRGKSKRTVCSLSSKSVISTCSGINCWYLLLGFPHRSSHRDISIRWMNSQIVSFGGFLPGLLRRQHFGISQEREANKSEKRNSFCETDYFFSFFLLSSCDQSCSYDTAVMTLAVLLCIWRTEYTCCDYLHIRHNGCFNLNMMIYDDTVF